MGGCATSVKSEEHSRNSQLANVPDSRPRELLKLMVFECGPESAPQPGDIVLIIGGGPAGVHMASLLKADGANPIVLESSSRAGGKSYTLISDGVPQQKEPCFFHPECHVPKALLANYQLDHECKPGAEDGDPDIYVRFEGVAGWIYGAVEKQLGKDFNKQAIRRYQAAHRKAMGNYEGTLPPEPSEEQWGLMNMSFREFLKRNDCLGIVPFALVASSEQGNGLLDRIPAFYGLMWLTADLMEAFLAAKERPTKSEPLLTMVERGWSNLWQTMVATDQLDVRLEHQVTSIHRSSDGVTVSGATSVGKGFELQGSHVFLACPFPWLASAMDLSADEQEIFDALAPFCMCTTHYSTAAPLERKQSLVFLPDGSPARRLSRRLSGTSNSDHDKGDLKPGEAGDPPSAAEAMGVPRKVHVGLQFLDRSVWRNNEGRLDAALLQTTLKQTLEGQGMTGVQIQRQYVWDDVYQFSQEGLARGLPWKILKMQGSQRTFYIGACASFGSVNDVTNYNLMIARHFGFLDAEVVTF